MDIQKVLMKLNIYLFDERWWSAIKIKKIWNIGSNSIKKGFESEPVYNEKYLKRKIKSYEDKISTNLYDDGIPKEGSLHLSVSNFDRFCF